MTTYPIVSYDISTLTTDASSKYGAPMGRDSWGIVDVDSDECLYAATRIVLYGDYDQGGAYWGGGGTPLYCVYTVGTDEVRQFVRAVSADAAFEQLEIPMHLRVTVDEPSLIFDCDGGMVEVSRILEMFDDARLYAEDFAGRYGTGREAYVKAQSAVEDWMFTPRLYETVRRWAGESDSTDQEIRAVVLQEMAQQYCQLERYGNSLDDCDEDYETPLAMLRGLEWSDDRECPVKLMVSESNEIYYYFDS